MKNIKLFLLLIAFCFLALPFDEAKAGEEVFRCTFDEPGATVKEIWEAKGGEEISGTIESQSALDPDGYTGRCMKVTYESGGSANMTMSIKELNGVSLSLDPITIVYYEKFSDEFWTSNSPQSVVTVTPYYGNSDTDRLAEFISIFIGGQYKINAFSEGVLSAGSNVSSVLAPDCVLNDNNLYDCKSSVQAEWSPGFGTEWVKVRIYVDLPSSSTPFPGTKDGTIKVWLNEVPTFELTDVQGHLAGQTTSRISFFPKKLAQEGYEHYIDDIVIYDGLEEPAAENLPPEIEITSHEGPYNTDEETITLLGTANDGNGVETLSVVRWINRQANTSTTTQGLATGTVGPDAAIIWSNWSATIDLARGQNEITVIAVDDNGVEASKDIIVHYQYHINQAPVVTITEPVVPPGQQFFTSDRFFLDISGTVEDEDSENVNSVLYQNSLGGVGLVSMEKGPWNLHQFRLNQGLNIITITATDDEGAQGYRTIQIDYNEGDVEQPPYLEIRNPDTPSATTTVDNINFSGISFNDDDESESLLRVRCQNGDYYNGIAIGTENWSCENVLLEVGQNTIEISAEDTNGGIATLSYEVTYNEEEPTIEIDSPPPTTVYNTIEITGRADDNLGVKSVTWRNETSNREGVATSTQGDFEGWVASDIPLVEGINEITFTVTDIKDVATSQTVNVEFTDTLPVINITEPSDSEVNTTLQRITISGDASDNLEVVSVSWDNSLSGDGLTTLTNVTDNTYTWTVELQLIEGRNNIKFTAQDSKGQPTETSINVVYIPIGPEIDITIPATENFNTSTDFVNIEGTAKDDEEVENITWFNSKDPQNTYEAVMGTTDPDGTVHWSAKVPLNGVGATEDEPILNIVLVTAIDNLNLSNSDMRNIYREANREPVITILTQPITVNRNSITLEGNVTDDNRIVSLVWRANGGEGDIDFDPNHEIADIDWTVDIPLTEGSNEIFINASDVQTTAAQSVIITYIAPIPTIDIQDPSEDTTVNTNSYLVAGIANDELEVEEIRVTNNGVDVGDVTITGPDTEKSWSVEVALTEGINNPNTIVATAINSTNKDFTDEVVITYVEPPPTIEIQSPEPDPETGIFDTQDPTLSISGIAGDNEENGIQSITCVNTSDNDASYSVTGIDSWSAEVDLIVGENVIEVTAMDVKGKTTTDSVTVGYSIYVNELPELVVEEPTDNILTDETTIPFFGSSSDNRSVESIVWNNRNDDGPNGNGEATNATGSWSIWSADVNIILGENIIDVTATDDEGAIRTVTVVVNRVLEIDDPPILVVTQPSTNPFATNAESIDIIGTSSDEKAFVITWINEATSENGAFDGVSNWSISPALDMGDNEITIKAIDSIGQETVVSLTINRSDITDTEPTITIIYPTEDPTQTIDTPIEIRWEIEDDKTGYITHWENNSTGASGNGNQYEIDRFSASIGLLERNNLITVFVTDSNGVTVKDTINIVRSTEADDPPTIAITSPTVNPYFNTHTGTISLEGDVHDDNVDFYVTWTNDRGGNGTATVMSGHWIVDEDIVLQEGTNIIEVTVTDSLGQVATDSINVEYNSDFPEAILITIE